jgi:hypothetical protein
MLTGFTGEILQGEASDGIQPGQDDRADQEGRCRQDEGIEDSGLEIDLNAVSRMLSHLYIMYHIHSYHDLNLMFLLDIITIQVYSSSKDLHVTPIMDTVILYPYCMSKTQNGRSEMKPKHI